MLILAILPLLALALAGGLVLIPAARLTALLAALFVTLWVASVMAVLLAKGFVWLYRILIMGHPRDLGEHAIGQLCGLHWSISLLHASHPSDVAEILFALSRRITELVHHTDPDAATRNPAKETQRDVAVCLEHGITMKRARDAARATAGVTPLPDHPVLVVALGRDRLLRELTTAPGMPVGAVPLLLFAMATVLGFNAWLIADVERADCAPTSCTGRPASYGDALYWLLNRLLGGDPEGLAAGSLPARLIGLTTSLMGLIVIGWVIASAFQRAIARAVASGPELARDYNLDLARDLSSEHTENQWTASPSPVVTPTVLAAGLVISAFLGYRFGRTRLRPPNTDRSGRPAPPSR